MTITHLQPYARLLLSGAVIFAVLATVAAASNALLQTNNVTAAGNDFSVATGDILEIAADVNNGPGTYGVELPDAFNAAGMVPGDTREFKFWLHNKTTQDVELHLFADLADYVFQHDGGNIESGATDLDSKMKVQFACDVINSGQGSTLDQTLTTWTTMASIKKPFDQDGGPAVLGADSSTNQAQCTMTVTLDSSSIAEGDSVQFNALFSGEQVLESPAP